MTNNKWDTRDQAYANHISLLTSEEFLNKKIALTKLSKALEEEGIRWRLAFSTNLFLRGIVDNFDDFDILVDMRDTEKLKNAIRRIGGRLPETVQKGVFSSPFYQEAYLDGIHMDLIGDITINTFNTTFTYRVTESECIIVNLDGDIRLPLCPIEALLILYGMMEGWQTRRRFKRELCREYLSNGLEYPQLLEDCLQSYNLPDDLEEIVKNLL